MTIGYYPGLWGKQPTKAEIEAAEDRKKRSVEICGGCGKEYPSKDFNFADPCGDPICNDCFGVFEVKMPKPKAPKQWRPKFRKLGQSS